MIIRTVTGDIAPESLQITDVHNHIFINLPEWVRKKDPDLALDDLEMNIEELLLFKRAGGKSFVDCTAIDYGRDVQKVKEIAEKTGVSIISVAGYKEDPFLRVWLNGAALDPLKIEEGLVRDVIVGVGDTGIKCGALKGSTSYNRITSLEEQILRCVSRAHRQTGAPILTHSTGGTMGLEQLDIFESEGVDLHRVNIGHCDLNPDPWLAKEIARRGAFVGYDSVGKSKYHPDSQRVEALKALVDGGYEDRVLLGMDIGRKSDCKVKSGGLGHGWLLTNFIPRLRSEGFSEPVLKKFLIENPKHWLAFEPLV
jgi:predicted metal-dependent phosphotriesterase family hydrolase